MFNNLINHEYFLFSRLSTFPWSRHCQLEAASIRCKFEKENKLMKRTIGWKRCKEKEEEKSKLKQRHLPLEITTNNLTEKNPKKNPARRRFIFAWVKLIDISDTVESIILFTESNHQFQNYEFWIFMISCLKPTKLVLLTLIGMSYESRKNPYLTLAPPRGIFFKQLNEFGRLSD